MRLDNAKKTTLKKKNRLKILNEIQIIETEDFVEFSTEIDYLINFFDDFSELVSCYGRVISFITDKEHFTLNTVLIDSATQTLKSIKSCCSIGSFSDANTLIRKLRDDLIQYIYILSVVISRKPFFEEDLKDLDIHNPEKFTETFLNLRINNYLNEDEQAISAWFSNSVSDLNRQVKKKLEFENYMKVLKQNENINKILIDHNLQEYWEILRKKLNDYVHNNGSKFSAQNNVKSFDEELSIHLKNITIRTSYISSLFLSLLLMVDSAIIMSSDYIDHLDCNIEPPEESQYFIANFIQEFIDTKVTRLHPELKQYLKDNNINGMKIE
jgi:hypothetical protein